MGTINSAHLTDREYLFYKQNQYDRKTASAQITSKPAILDRIFIGSNSGPCTIQLIDMATGTNTASAANSVIVTSVTCTAGDSVIFNLSTQTGLYVNCPNITEYTAIWKNIASR